MSRKACSRSLWSWAGPAQDVRSTPGCGKFVPGRGRGRGGVAGRRRRLLEMGAVEQEEVELALPGYAGSDPHPLLV